MTRKCTPCSGIPPTPYYKDMEDKNSLTQEHSAIFRDTQYAAGIEFPDEFVVPVIDEDILVLTKNLVNVVVGSYIWSPNYGYLKISSWDSNTEKIGLLNEDITGAAIPGTVVSAGSLFAVTARPCCADQDNFSLFPFLVEDYVVPGVGSSVTLAVTSTFGLIEGTLVRIGSNIYLLDQINSSLEIQVTNQGAGGTSGTTISARDANDVLQYLITQAVASACSSPGSDTIRLLGCDGNTESILEGDFPGQVPVLQNSSTEEVEFKLLDTEVRTCTFLTAAVNVLTSTQTYTIHVDDESIFSIDDVLQIHFGDLRWKVTSNTTPGELDIICTTGDPGSNFIIPSGSSVCLQLTTDSLRDEITDVSQTNVPPGSIVMYGGAAAPAGYLLCDGAAISRSTYSDLFTAIGITYGLGDGTTTFNVPDVQQRFPLGKATAGTGAVLGASGGAIDHTHTGPSHTHDMANHTHDMGNHTHSVPAHTHGPGGNLRATIGVDLGDSAYIRMRLDGSNLFPSDYKWTASSPSLVADGGHTTPSVLVDGTTASGGSGTSGNPSTNTASGPSINTTSASGTGATSTANSPFITVNFIIKF